MTRLGTPPPSPKALACLAVARLRREGDAAVARRGRTFFKQHEDVRLYGVTTPAVRALVRELCQQVPNWNPDEAVQCCDVLIRETHLEAKLLGIVLLGRFESGLDKPVLNIVESWIAEGHCANWATIDGLAPELITPLVVRFPELVPRVVAWARSENLWLRRAAVVAFVPIARRGERLDTAYRLVESLAHDPEDLLHKACGWLLREAGKTDMQRLEQFLTRAGHQLPRTTVRYAIERFPESKRKTLLEQTQARDP